MEDKEIIKIVIDLLDKIKTKERKEAQKILKENIKNYLYKNHEKGYIVIDQFIRKLNNGEFDD